MIGRRSPTTTFVEVPYCPLVASFHRSRIMGSSRLLLLIPISDPCIHHVLLQTEADVIPKMVDEPGPGQSRVSDKNRRLSRRDSDAIEAPRSRKKQRRQRPCYSCEGRPILRTAMRTCRALIFQSRMSETQDEVRSAG